MKSSLVSLTGKKTLTMLLFALALGCSERNEITVDLNGGNSDLPRLDDPFTPEETLRLRREFDWSATSALPETDADGHPALRYVIAYVHTADERTLLDAMGPHSPLPLFAAERTRWDGQSGRFGFFGDGEEGLFHFAIIPAATYNLVRELALEGRPPFLALILRPIPVPEADNGDGTLDYAWAAERGFRLRDDVDLQAPSEARAEPLLFELLALLSREVRDEGDGVLGDLTRIDRAGTNFVQTQVLSTDPAHSALTRAWGTNDTAGRVAGEALTLDGVEVVVEYEVGIARRRTNSRGAVEVPVAVGSRATFCVRAQNEAVQVDELFEASQACAFTDQQAADGNRIVLRVSDPIFNLVAQYSDAREYARRVMGYRITHRTSVLIGFYADLFGEFQTADLPDRERPPPRAFVACGSYTSPLSLIWVYVAQILSGGFPVSAFSETMAKVMAHDIFFPDIGRARNSNGSASNMWSRATPTHEFGHFLECDMLSHLGGDGDLTEGWGEIVFTTLFAGGQEDGTQNLAINEGVADYFETQVVGATNYSSFGENDDGHDEGHHFYCDPRLAACTEQNIGGVTQRTSRARLAGGRDNQGFYQDVAVATTLLQDAVDGPERTLPEGVMDSDSAGAFFVQAPSRDDTAATNLIGTAPSVWRLHDAMDEAVNLSGRMLPDLFREMSTRGNTLNNRNFYGALSAVARRDHTAAEVCDMFGIHTPSGACTDIAPADSAFPPAEPLITTASVDAMNNITWGWRDVSSAATGYAFEVVRGDGTLSIPRTRRPYARADEFVQRGVEFDRRFTVRIATVNDTLESEFAERSVQSFAEPVRDGSGTALRGGVQLDWTAVQATAYAVHDVTGGRDLVVAHTSDASVTLRGLLGGVERTYRIVSENAIGLPSAASPDIRVTPLPPAILYVATFGNDTAVGAGSATQPFRTLRAALAQAAATSADEIILHEGLFEETGPLAVRASITLRGGYRAASGVWTDADAVTLVQVTGGASVTTCSTLSFNEPNAPTTAAVTIASGTSVALVNVDVTGVRGSVPLTQCFTTLHADGATLSVERSSIATALGGCSSALMAIGGTLTLTASELMGASHRAPSLPTNLDVTSVAACDGTQIVVEEVTLSGASAPLLTTEGEIVSASALSGRAIRSLRVQRSFLRSLLAGDGWSALHGRLTSLQVTATQSVFVANSVIRTPHGGDDNRAIDVAGASSPLRAFQLYHDTVIVGSDWEAARPAPLPSYGAVVSLRGDVESVDMFNNALSYAGGGVDLVSGTRFTGIDRSDTTADPSFFNFAGNAVSIPYVSNWHIASLTQCFADSEFGMAVTEAQLNTSSAHECHDGARSGWMVRTNFAFNHAVSPERALSRFAADGYPDEASRTHLFFVGEVTESLPLASEVRTDIRRHTRMDPRSTGAWVGDDR